MMPKVTVLPPPFTPPRYGLQSVVIPRADGRADLGGVEWLSETCGNIDHTYWADPGRTPPPPGANVGVSVDWTAAGAPGEANVTVAVTATGRRSIDVQIQGQPRVAAWAGATSSAGTVDRGAPFTITAVDPHSGTTDTDTFTVPGGGAGGHSGDLTLTGVPFLKDAQGATAAGRYGRGEPFTVFHTLGCAEHDLDGSRSRLERGGQTLNAPVLTDTTETTFPIRVEGITAALARLEESFYWSNSVQGIIHAPRWVYSHAANAGLIVRDRNILRTPADTMWAFGTGYDSYTGPAGTGETAADGESWLFMTSPVSQWRSDTQVLPTVRDAALDRSTNDVEMLAERTYVLAYECDAIAVLASFPAGGGGGGGGGF